MRRDLTSDVTQPWNVNDSTQTQQTTSLGRGYCAAIWCMSDFNPTQTARAMSVALFLCAHTQNVFTHNHEARVLSVPTSTNELSLCDLIMKNLWPTRGKNHGPTFPCPIPALSASPHYRKYVVRHARKHIFASGERRTRTLSCHIGSVMPAVAHQVRVPLQIPQVVWLFAAGLPKDPSNDSGKHAATMAE